MAHPRKKRRTQAAPSEAPSQNAKTSTGARIPKSMVIRMGASDVGASVTKLVQDTRQIMEPHTASRLKERRSNRLRDYTTMAGPLGISHLMLFSRGKESGNVNMRLAITPRGPTLNFRVEKYSLCKDIAKSQKKPMAGGLGRLEHVTPPLLVMNNFNSPDASTNSTIPKHLESLLTTTFQSLFPPIAPQTTPLGSIKRILLLNRETADVEEGAYIVNLRHYAITSRIVHQNLSRGFKRLQRVEKNAIAKSKTLLPSRSSNGSTNGSNKKAKGLLPNLNRLDDVADFVLDPASGGYTSASETELDTDAEVDVVVTSARKVMNKRDRARMLAAREAELAEQDADAVNDEDVDDAPKKKGKRPPPVQKRAIKLTELGPRMRLRLVKVEEGMCEGKVMWHEYISKTREEERKQEAVWVQRKKEKEERKRVQKENLAAKRKAKGDKGEDAEDDDLDDDDEGDNFDDDAWDDEEAEDMEDD